MNTQAIRNADQDLQPSPDWPARHARSSVAMKEAPMTHNIDWTALYAALSEPFDPSLIRYRAGATNRYKTKAQALPYVDPRTYEDRLNHLVPGSWEVTFEPWGNDRIICRLTIHGVTRSSTGEATDSPDGIAGTSAEAQAFKRACAKFGLGRHLYATTPRWMPYDATRRTIQTPPPEPTPAAHAMRNSSNGTAASTLGPERGDAMHRELTRIGLDPSQHLTYASRILGRPVKEFAHLPDNDAQLVWRAVRLSSRLA